MEPARNINWASVFCGFCMPDRIPAGCRSPSSPFSTSSPTSWPIPATWLGLSAIKVVSVAWAPPSGGLRAYVVPGHALAPHVAASAKAILAFQSKDIVDKALAEPLAKLTAKTKTRRKAVDQDYRAVRENGYATCWDEMEAGMGAIAVPIRLPGVGVMYSLGVAGLIDRLKRRPVSETVEWLRSAAEPIGRTLQIRQPPHRPSVWSRKRESSRARTPA